jgi:hypothetical protein
MVSVTSARRGSTLFWDNLVAHRQKTQHASAWIERVEDEDSLKKPRLCLGWSASKVFAGLLVMWALVNANATIVSCPLLT